MPLQNRVQPNGDILPLPHRGTLMGNRGILHDDNKRLGVARWRHKAWVCCVLAFKGRKRRLMAAGNYTELFFWMRLLHWRRDTAPASNAEGAIF